MEKETPKEFSITIFYHFKNKIHEIKLKLKLQKYFLFLSVNLSNLYLVYLEVTSLADNLAWSEILCSLQSMLA